MRTSMGRFRIAVQALIAFVLLVSGAHASAATPRKTLRVAAASDLKFAMPSLVELYEKRHPGEKVEAIFGSSGSFVQQILSGAPLDLFLSADESYAVKVKEAGKAQGEVFQYGTGRLVLWLPKALMLIRKEGESTAALLLKPEVKKFAMANPAVAPYGRAADEALKKSGLQEKLRSKMVMGENVAQTAQYAATGSVSCALIALALAESPEMQALGSYILFDVDEAPELKQTGVVLKTNLSKQAEAFKTTLLSDEGQRVLAAHGLAEVRK
jgi:molybdate transport system substrate-binding protein